jgi:hypothetical protein
MASMSAPTQMKTSIHVTTQFSVAVRAARSVSLSAALNIKTTQ